MGLPVTFLIGAAILLLHDQIVEALPGPPQPGLLLPFLLLIPVPWLLVRWFAVRTLRFAEQRGTVRALRIAAVLLPFSVPLAYAAMVFGGRLPANVGAIVGESTTLYLLLALLPLLAMEVSYRLAERSTAVRAARRGILLLAPAQLSLTWLVLLPILLMALLSDATRAHRGLHVFLTATALGHLCTFALTVLVMSVMLPLLFRYVMPTSKRLPPGIADDVHATARALDFPPRSVLALRTDLRVANAAMVGPLPWPRYLVLTDALMALLEPFSLRGVVAHEVGHARAGHPGLLLLVFVVVPVLSFHAVWLTLYDASPSTLVLAAGGAFVLALLLLRWIAHRFEYEADQLSAHALGGAAPCIEALRRVGGLWSRGNQRATLRHPTDRQRIEQLLRWERDPAERARFARTGRRVRGAIGATLVAAVLAATWAQSRLWPLDRIQLAYSTGAFPEAKRRLDELGADVQAPFGPAIDELRRELDAAMLLVPEGGPWEQIRHRLAEGGIERGMRMLRQGDAEAALPWLSLALCRPDPEPWRQTAYLLARAAADGDRQRVRRLLDHLEQLEPPEDVRSAVSRLSDAGSTDDGRR